MTTSDYIIKAKQRHGNQYDYSKTQFVDKFTKVCITCPIHGDFFVLPHVHTRKNGTGCPHCSLQKRTTSIEEFIEKAKLQHGDKYDYTKVQYLNSHHKVCIICPEHGEFWQIPQSHLKGRGCPQCTSLHRFKTTQQFIDDAKKVHGDRYDYSKVEYRGNKTKICIICHEHGEFWQTPAYHLIGRGCYKCGQKAKNQRQILGNTLFIQKAKKIHGDKYDYSKINYVNSDTKVCIVCPEHGEFWQTPSSHLSGRGCKLCNKLSNKNTKQLRYNDFIQKAKNIHGNKYDYSKVNYVNSNTKVCIVCPEHGEFWQLPTNHLKGQGCKVCACIKQSKRSSLSTNDFIKRAQQIHGDKYDYSKVNYINAKTKVCIICHEHGEFWQTPSNHLAGYGCHACSKGKSAKEIKLKEILEAAFHNEEIIFQAHISWLKYQSFDFYFPKYRLAIEYQGGQHFVPIQYFGGKKAFIETRERDIRKYNISQENNCTILYFSFDKCDTGDFPYQVLMDEISLITAIKKHIYETDLC